MERTAERIENRKCECGEPGGFSVRPLGDQPGLKIVPEHAYQWRYKDGHTEPGYASGSYCFECAKKKMEKQREWNNAD